MKQAPLCLSLKTQSGSCSSSLGKKSTLNRNRNEGQTYNNNVSQQHEDDKAELLVAILVEVKKGPMKEVGNRLLLIFLVQIIQLTFSLLFKTSK